MKQLLFIAVLLLGTIGSYAQIKFDVVKAGGQYMATGSESLGSTSSQKAFANAMLWILNRANVGKDNIRECDMQGQAVTARLRMAESENAKQAYTCDVKVTISSGQIVILANNIKGVSNGLLGESTLAFEKLNLEKKEKHKEMFDEYKRLVNKELNQLLKYVQDNDPGAMPHWRQVCAEEIVAGMTENECMIVMGKPLSVTSGSERSQWMYSTSEYLIFSNGLLKAHIR